MKEYYIIVNFDTEAYEPNGIASVSDVFTSFDKALAGLSCEWDDIALEENEEMWKYDRKQGALIRNDGRKGFYIERVYVNN